MKLSPKHLEAIVLLSKGSTARDVSKKLDVTPQTISEWRKIPLFEAKLNTLKEEIITTGRDSIRASTTCAVECLTSLVTEGKNEETRRKAAINILTIAGIADPSDGRHAFGIGPTSVAKLEQKRQLEEEHDVLMKSIFKASSKV